MNKSLRALYSEIGSENRVDSILSKFYRRMASDILIGFFFREKDLDSIVKKQKGFLLRAMGQRKTYNGKSPRMAHRNLPPILKGHFDRRLVLLKETLAAEGLSKKAIETWIRFEENFRKSIIEA